MSWIFNQKYTRFFKKIEGNVEGKLNFHEVGLKSVAELRNSCDFQQREKLAKESARLVLGFGVLTSFGGDKVKIDTMITNLRRGGATKEEKEPKK